MHPCNGEYLHVVLLAGAASVGVADGSIDINGTDVSRQAAYSYSRELDPT